MTLFTGYTGFGFVEISQYFPDGDYKCCNFQLCEYFV